jgi:hypothetical protein
VSGPRDPTAAQRRQLLTGLGGLAAIAALPRIAQAQALRTEVIDLRWRQADEVLPVLQALVAAPGTVSALGRQLVVRATPAELAQLQAVLARIDRAPRRLQVTVTQDADVARSRDAIGVGGTAADGGPAVRVDRSRAAERTHDAQRVQVLEGSSAFIATGETVPVTQRRWITRPDGRRVMESTAIRQAQTGFTVRPRVDGDIVTVEITAGRERFTDPGRLDGRTRFDRVDTVVQGRLGEWIAVGGGAGVDDLDERSLTLRSTDAAREDRQSYLKVEVLP